MSKDSKISNFRSQLKATSIKALKKSFDEDNALLGVQTNEYLNLEDGKTLKIRIFPAHPGTENFYISKKCYWLSVAGRDGDMRRTTVLCSKKHGDTELDLVDEYVKFAKRKWSKDAEKLEALVGTGQNSNSLNPTYTWLCYADVVSPDEPLKAKLWEFKKTVRDLLNKLSCNEDDDQPIEVDPFTDPEEGLPVNVKYMKKPNKKKGENYYEVTFPKKANARPLTDEEIEYFMGLKPLNEILSKYGMKDFEKALEGLQNFDEEHEMELFEDEDWLEIVEKVKSQYEEEEEEEVKPKKKVLQKSVSKKKVEEDEDDEEEEEEEEVKPKKGKKVVEEDDEEEAPTPKKKAKKVVEEDDEEEEEEEEVKPKKKAKKVVEEDEDEEEEAPTPKKKAKKVVEEDDEDEEEEEVKPRSKVTLEDIKKKLSAKK